MAYYTIPGDAALFVSGNRIEAKHYIMLEKNGKTEAWTRNGWSHIYTLNHETKTITFGPDFQQVYVWHIGGRVRSRPILYKIEPPPNYQYILDNGSR